MQSVVRQVIPGATAAELFGAVESLDRYPSWMRLVHRATPLDPDDGRAAWWVELRARVGPFTRSKQLRMVRTVHEAGRRARFERVQADDRDHAEWILDALIDDLHADAEGGAAMTMSLEYTGQLWSKAILGRILDDEIRRATRRLIDLVGSGGVVPAPSTTLGDSPDPLVEPTVEPLVDAGDTADPTERSA